MQQNTIFYFFFLKVYNEFLFCYRQEIADLERQQEMAKDNFDRISRQIKKEVEMFDVRKANDFKRSIVKYLEYMLKAQEKMTAQWERYLPEVQQISI